MCLTPRPLRSSHPTLANEIATIRSVRARGPRSTSSLRKLVIIVAVIACCTTRGKSFLGSVPPPGSSVGSSNGSFRHRCSAASRDLIDGISSSSSSSISRRTPYSNQDRRNQHSFWRGVGNGRGHEGRSVLMAAASGGMGPGKGTQVVLLRHGMSTFNKLNIFTGWCDVPLADEGKKEALEAGKLLATAGYKFDVAHSSVLKRACTSLHRLLEGSGQPYIPIKTTWRLNERHYGALQGRNKAKLEEAMGDIVVEWRRGYSTRPPAMVETHPHYPLISMDSRYRGLVIPESESLRDTANRVMDYWESDIVPDIRAGKRVVVVAHANTLRSLVKRLDGIEEDAIRYVNIPTGEPFMYEFDADLRPMGEPDEHGFRGRFVGDMMAEKDAAVDEYKRREQACFDKWEKNPELVPEECLCEEDMQEVDASPAPFGEAQASLGLDRYSVGYDLPLPSFFTADASASANPKEAGEEVEVGGPILDAMVDFMEGRDGGQGRKGLGEREGERVPDRNETSSAPSV